MRATAPLLIAASLLVFHEAGAAATPAAPQQYYRCGPKGQDLRDTPCPAEKPGSAVDLPEDKVTPDQYRAARQRNAQDARDADALRREREQQDARTRTTAPGGIQNSLKTQIDLEADQRTGVKPPKHPKPPKPKTPPKPKKPDPAASVPTL